MDKKRNAASTPGSSLNTLAQSETDIREQLAVIIQGHGSELGNEKAIKGRAKRKLLSQKLSLNLISIAEKKGHWEKVKLFWNTYHCQSRIYTYEGRLYGKYCKNRFCTLCCSIRKASIINRYYPVINKWGRPYFVTLTVKAVNLKMLPEVVKSMVIGFDRIKDKYRKRKQRNKDISIMGIRSLECEFNPERRTYNPHFHLIVATKQMAELLVNEWLALWKPKNGIIWSVKKAQHIIPVYNLDNALIEIIKYGSKIFTEPDVNKKNDKEINYKIYAAALYNIFDAMKGLRIFERFGFNLPGDIQSLSSGVRVVKGFGEWIFTAQHHDWLNTYNELVLSSFEPSGQLQNILNNNIDIE